MHRRWPPAAERPGDVDAGGALGGGKVGDGTRVGRATKASHQEASPAKSSLSPASAGWFNPKNYNSAKVAPAAMAEAELAKLRTDLL